MRVAGFPVAAGRLGDCPGPPSACLPNPLRRLVLCSPAWPWSSSGCHNRNPLPCTAARISRVSLESALALACILLAPFAAVGLTLINTGLGRSRNAAHAMTSSLAVLGVAGLAYFVCGFAFQGYPGLPAHVIHAGGKEWDWLGAGPWFLRGLTYDGSPASLSALLGMFAVGLAALIPLGAGAERWRLAAICASTAILAGWIWPLFASLGLVRLAGEAGFRRCRRLRRDPYAGRTHRVGGPLAARPTPRQVHSRGRCRARFPAIMACT